MSQPGLLRGRRRVRAADPAAGGRRPTRVRGRLTRLPSRRPGPLPGARAHQSPARWLRQQSPAPPPDAASVGLDPSTLSPGQMTYHLRRLRLHGLTARLPHTHRYQVTPEGLRLALFCTRLHARVLRPGISARVPTAGTIDHTLRPPETQLV